MGALPIGVLLYQFRGNRLVGFAVGAVAATAASVYRSDIWMGPFLVSTFGFSTFFKSVNTGWQQYPAGADRNLYSWLLWFLFIPEPVFDKENMVKAKTSDILNAVGAMLGKVFGLFVLLSILRSSSTVDYVPLPEVVPAWLGLHIQGFFHVWFIYLWASFCLDFSRVSSTGLTGRMFHSGFKNPLITSRSFRESWGQRWNTPVQIILQRSVYVPCRKCKMNRFQASILTFAASGLLHEYNFFIHNNIAYAPGVALFFFILMGGIMVAENAVQQRVPSLFDQVPSFIIASVLTSLAAGLVESFFIPSWIKAGAISCAASVMPHVVCGAY